MDYGDPASRAELVSTPFPGEEQGDPVGRTAAYRAILMHSPGEEGWVMIAVGLFDEQEIFRRGAVACIAEDPMLEVVAEGPTVPEAVRAADLDVAVVSPAIASAGRISCPMVVCGTGETAATAIAGDDRVSAVFPRTELSPAQLVSAIRAAAAGLRIRPQGHPGQGLDLRSRRVLEMLANGAATREISASLGYSERTIKAVIQDLERSLGARSRAHAVALALREHMI